MVWETHPIPTLILTLAPVLTFVSFVTVRGWQIGRGRKLKTYATMVCFSILAEFA